MAPHAFRLQLPDTSGAETTIAEYAFKKPSDAVHMTRRARLLCALAGLTSKPRVAFSKSVGEAVRVMARRGLAGTVRLSLTDFEGQRVVEVVVAANESINAGGECPDGDAASDLDAARAQLELLFSRLTGSGIRGWQSSAPHVTLMQALPPDSRFPSQRESLYWAELLDAPTPEDAAASAQRRGEQLASELGFARAQEQTPESISAAHASRSDLETLSVVVSRASHAILIMDADGMIQWVNDAFTTLSGYTQTDVTAKRFDELLFGPSTSGDCVREFHQALRNGYELTCDLLQYHRDGRTCWVEFKLIPVHDAAGRLNRWVALERDITRRRQTEEALRAAKQSAEESSRAKSEFLANMSHEIRTPLNAILGMTELCLATQLHSDQRDYLRTVQSSADTLLQLLNDILDLSKIEAGKMELDETDFNLAEVIRDTLKALAVRAHEKHVDLMVHMPMDLPQYLRGDPVRLRQVLFNLVGNAIKFTQRGEVVVEVEEQWCGEGEIGLHFSVRDTGIGIPADRLEKIFESFTQVDASMARRFGGTGLGLTITAQLLQLMHGRIWVRSTEGRGSTFHFTVRFRLGQPPQRLSSMPAAQLAGKGALIVDDNATNRRILDQMLQHWGVSTTVADSASSAMLALEQAARQSQPFDIVLLDAMMPSVDGFQLAEAIHERRDLQVDKVVMLSSADRPNAARRCRELGIASFVVKPVSAATLLHALLEALGAERTGGRELASNESPGQARLLGERVPAERALLILIADDHAANRELAAEILRRRGHQCLAVGDGDEALAMFEREPIDLVLMDVQMPNMDGLTATREIRQRERKSGGRTPIVALTAHALAGDREKCLAAGMDAYLAKPLHGRELVALVEKMGGVEEQTRLERPAGTGVLRKAEFDFSAALERMGGETDLLYEHMRYMLNDAPHLLHQIREALSTKNGRLLELAAHRLKSLVSSYNHDEARQLAIELEQFGKTASFDNAGRTFARLTPLVDALSDAIFNYMEQQRHHAS